MKRAAIQVPPIQQKQKPKEAHWGLEEMAQKLRTRAALSEDPVWLPAPTWLPTSITGTPVPRDLMSSSGLYGHCIHTIETYM